MSDDFDRSVGGLIAEAMQSTVAAFVVAIAALALASFAFSAAYQFVDDPSEFLPFDWSEIFDTAIFVLLFGVPMSFLRIVGIPLALFQVYCFYAILYEDGNRPQRAVWLFFSQLVAACVCFGSTDYEWSPSLKALLLSVFLCGLPFAIRWSMVRSKRGESGR